MKTGYGALHGAAAVALLLLPVAALAKSEKSDKPWSLSVQAGARYDNNITVEQTDLKTAMGDAAGVFELDASYNLIDTSENKLQVAYEFSQSVHADLSSFDIQSHAFALSGSTEVGELQLGGHYSFNHMLLGGDDFLDMHMVAPNFGWFPVPSVFLQGTYYYFDKDFAAAFDSRDATNQQPGVSAMYFFNNSKSYVSLGANYETEDAVGPEFDYDGYALRAAIRMPLEFAQRQGKIKFDYTYLQRFYSNVTPSIGVKRRENRSKFRASAEMPLVGALSLLAQYQFIARDSNLPAANYTENVIEGSLKYKF